MSTAASKITKEEKNDYFQVMIWRKRGSEISSDKEAVKSQNSIIVLVSNWIGSYLSLADASAEEQASLHQDASKRLQEKSKRKNRHMNEELGTGSLVASREGYTRRLGGKIGSGGTSHVYRVDGLENVAAKIFSTEYLEGFGDVTRNKVESLLLMFSRGKLVNINAKLAKPRTLLFDTNGRWVGYSMEVFNGNPLSRLTQTQLQKMHYPNATRLHVVGILLEISSQVLELNAKKLFLGDFNPGNFLVSKEFSKEFFSLDSPSSVASLLDRDVISRQVFLVDVDGYEIHATLPNRKIYRCDFIKDEYLPPEAIRQSSKMKKLTEESEAFSFSILLFQSLMQGRHPYDQVGGGGIVDNILAAHFPYGLGGAPPGEEGAIPDGPWYLLWSHLPYKLKQAFIASFGDGANTPTARTSIEEWQELLTIYRNELARGWHNNELTPSAPKSREYRGNLM